MAKCVIYKKIAGCFYIRLSHLIYGGCWRLLNDRIRLLFFLTWFLKIISNFVNRINSTIGLSATSVINFAVCLMAKHKKRNGISNSHTSALPSRPCGTW